MENKYVANLSINHYTVCFLYPPTNSCLDKINFERNRDDIIQCLNFSILIYFSLILFKQTYPLRKVCISDDINRYNYFDVLQLCLNRTSDYLG